MIDKPSVCILPVHRSVGGPASFHARLSKGLAERGIATHHDIGRQDCTAVLVIAGTSRLDRLWSARRRGIRIVQRLDGMNWTHKRTRTGLRHCLRAEWYNWVQAYIRRNLASEIVYQSHFTRAWWNKVYGEISSPCRVIHNGVDLQLFHPAQPLPASSTPVRFLVIEGHLGGGHEQGFHNAVDFITQFQQHSKKAVELSVIGDVPADLKLRYAGLPWINWVGIVKREQIPSFHKNAHFYLPCEIHAACPNALIEAMASGTPIIGYDTGAVRELVGTEGGIVVPYGADDDRLQPANPDPLIQAADKILSRLADFRRSARERAECEFDVGDMVAAYIDALHLS